MRGIFRSCDLMPDCFAMNCTTPTLTCLPLAAAMNQFIDYALSQPDVWFVTMSEVSTAVVGNCSSMHACMQM